MGGVLARARMMGSFRLVFSGVFTRGAFLTPSEAHAVVVSKFVEKGFDEAHKEHPLPDEGKKK